MAGKRRRRGQQNRTGNIWISVIVMTLLLVMSIQIVRLHDKNQVYLAKEESLEAQLEEEKERAKELEDYEEYTKTDKFIEDMAKSRLGLVHKNEIIFKKE